MSSRIHPRRQLALFRRQFIYSNDLGSFSHLGAVAAVRDKFRRCSLRLPDSNIGQLLQRSVGGALHERVVTNADTGTLLPISVSSLAMHDAERAAADPSITHFPDALR